MAEIAQNRVTHENLPQSHAARICGAAIEAPSHEELARRMCEAVVQTISRTVLDVFLEKFNELANRMAADQKALQTEMLKNLRASPGRLGDGTANEEVIDVEAQAPAEPDRRGSSQVKVGQFMHEQWCDSWTEAGINVKSYLLQFSMLLKAKSTQSAGR